MPIITNPIQILPMNTAQAAAFADWNRDAPHITINQKPITKIVEEERGGQPSIPGQLFQNEEQLKEFLKTHLLAGLPAEQREDKFNQIFPYLHQGALTSPIAGPIALYLTKGFSHRAPEKMQLYNEDMEPIPNPESIQSKQVNFKTNRTGFTVTEVVTQKALANELNTSWEQSAPYLYKVKGCVTVDLSGEQPNLQAPPKLNKIDSKSANVTFMLQHKKIAELAIQYESLRELFGVKMLAATESTPWNAEQRTQLSPEHSDGYFQPERRYLKDVLEEIKARYENIRKESFTRRENPELEVAAITGIINELEKYNARLDLLILLTTLRNSPEAMAMTAANQKKVGEVIKNAGALLFAQDLTTISLQAITTALNEAVENIRTNPTAVDIPNVDSAQLTLSNQLTQLEEDFTKACVNCTKAINDLTNTQEARIVLTEKLGAIQLEKQNNNQPYQIPTSIRQLEELTLEARYNKSLQEYEGRFKFMGNTNRPYKSEGIAKLALIKEMASEAFAGKPDAVPIHKITKMVQLEHATLIADNDVARLECHNASAKYAQKLIQEHPQNRHAKSWGKIALVCLGVALIVASVAFAAATYGFGTPASIAGIATGSAIIMGAVAGTGAAGAALAGGATYSAGGFSSLFKGKKAALQQLKEGADQELKTANKKAVVDADPLEESFDHVAEAEDLRRAAPAVVPNPDEDEDEDEAEDPNSRPRT